MVSSAPRTKDLDGVTIVKMIVAFIDPDQRSILCILSSAALSTTVAMELTEKGVAFTTTGTQFNHHGFNLV